MNDPFMGVSATELADCLQKTVAHLIECERQLDEFHGLGADAGSGVSTIVCDADLMLKRYNRESQTPQAVSQTSNWGLELKVQVLESQLAEHEQLLMQVSKTCGQGNCNCVGSNRVKYLAGKLGGDTNIARGRR